LQDNWNTFKGNYVNNSIAADRLNYHVLFHTDLSREDGYSNGIYLGRINRGNFDLVVIDKSRNFRNGGDYDGSDRNRENRYSASTYKESTDTGYISRLHLGAFFAPQKTGLCGGSVPPLHGVTAPRPSNPLRTNRQHPKG
jgi:hypothetical protein